MREARTGDHITKLTAVAPAPPGTQAPLWTAFLARIFRHDPELIPFVQRALGYALTGEMQRTRPDLRLGQGGNGKGVLLNTAAALWATTPPWRPRICCSSPIPTGTHATWPCCAAPGW